MRIQGSDRRGEPARPSNRGQTLQDYALGISVFLITVILFLVTVLPSVLPPATDNVGADRTAQAERVAAEIVTNTSVPGKTNRLNASTVERIVALDEDALRDRYRLPQGVQINVSLTTMNGSRVVQSTGGVDLTTGSVPVERSVASSSRLVTLTDDSCDTACRLTVRVW